MDWKSTECVIELAGNQNQQFVFDPLGATLRGRWERTNVMEVSSNTDFGRMPTIPGIYVALDLKIRTLRAIDPLGFSENQDLLREANAIQKQWFGERRPWDTMTKRGLTDTDLKSALWKMRELLDADKAIVRHGKLPGRKEILDMPGKLRLRYGTAQIIDPINHIVESPYATDEEMAAIMAFDGQPDVEVTKPALAGV